MAWELDDYLPSDSGLDWLNKLHEQHASACREWYADVQAAFSLEDAIDEKARDWRRRVRDAVAVGEQPPEDKGFSMDVERARVEVAIEDAEVARDALGLVVVEALTECRARRSELEDVALGVELAGALRAGLSGGMFRIRHEMEQRLAELNEPAIVNLEDPASEPLTRSEPKETANAAA